MIIIKAIFVGGFKNPERILTEDELKSTDGLPVYSDLKNYYYFENQEEANTFLGALPKIENPPTASVAFEAFKQCSDEEKKLIAQSLKEFL